MFDHTALEYPRSHCHLEIRMLHKCGLKVSHICYIHLTISIKCHNIPPVMLISMSPYVLKSCLECRSSATIDEVTQIVNLSSIYPCREEGSRGISRTIIYDQYLIISSIKNTLYHRDDTRRFIVGTYEKYDMFFGERHIWGKLFFDTIMESILTDQSSEISIQRLNTSEEQEYKIK